MWVVLVLYSEYHEDGISFAVGPFESEDKATVAEREIDAPNSYVVELRRPNG